jgi:hypothetical protein
MSDENDLTIRILREIQASQTEMKGDIALMKGDIALIKDKMVQHSLQLSAQGGSIGEIARILRYFPDWARQSPADVLEQLRDLQERVSALESRRQ